MPFLSQPSPFIRAWDRHQGCSDLNNLRGWVDKDMLNSLSKTKAKGVRELFDKKLVQAATRTKYKLGLGAKNGNRRRGKLI